jgi:hypothetical protein
MDFERTRLFLRVQEESTSTRGMQSFADADVLGQVQVGQPHSLLLTFIILKLSMGFLHSLVILFILFASRSLALPQKHSPRDKSAPGCKPFRTEFSDLESSQFRPISDQETFKMDNSGLSMFLDRPKGVIGTTHDGRVNDKLADGATMNSTFYMQ